jgi:hypothetical protein
LVVHGLLSVVVAWFFLRPRASAYFRAARTVQTPEMKPPAQR